MFSMHVLHKPAKPLIFTAQFCKIRINGLIKINLSTQNKNKIKSQWRRHVSSKNNRHFLP